VIDLISLIGAALLAVLGVAVGSYLAGRKTMKVEQDVDELKEQVREAEKLIEEIKIVEEIRNEVAAMDDDQLRDAGYQWVRNRREDGRSQ